MNLPSQPGLSRRLAYGNHVKRRNSILLNVNNSLAFSMYRYTIEPQTYREFKNDQIGLSLQELLSNTKIEIERLPFFCTICQNTKTEIDISRSLICKHKFHIECIEIWLAKNKTCPICRYKVKS
jgi:hypothetical protein